MGGGTPEQFTEGADKLRAAWEAAGREGEPRTLALEAASMVAGSAATDAETAKAYVEAFRAAGCDELVLFPCDPDPDQVDLLADAVLELTGR